MITSITTVYSFLYVQLYFRTFRIDITPGWNNYYNLTNVPTKLIPQSNDSGTTSSLQKSHYHNYLLQASFLFVASARKSRENLQFDCKRFEIWLVNTGEVKKMGVGKLDLFQYIHWYSYKSWQILQLLSFLILVGAGDLFSRTDYFVNLSFNLLISYLYSSSK